MYRLTFILIGTMNTADRSIALLDKALRRRFGFVECMPDSGNPGRYQFARGFRWGRGSTASIAVSARRVGRDARNLQIGHSYLMEKDRPIGEFTRFVQVLQDEIIPLLEEYCYEDFSTMADILGNGGMDTRRIKSFATSSSRIRAEPIWFRRFWNRIPKLPPPGRLLRRKLGVRPTRWTRPRVKLRRSNKPWARSQFAFGNGSR